MKIGYDSLIEGWALHIGKANFDSLSQDPDYLELRDVSLIESGGNYFLCIYQGSSEEERLVAYGRLENIDNIANFVEKINGYATPRSTFYTNIRVMM